MISEITTGVGGDSYCLLVVCCLGNLAHAMKKSEDLHDVI
jgi:hypothetical protein